MSPSPSFFARFSSDLWRRSSSSSSLSQDKFEFMTFFRARSVILFNFQIRKSFNWWAEMDPESARTARESLDLVFHISNILETGLDRHTLSILIALCDMGINPESLAAIVKELRRESPPLSSSSPA